MALSAGTPLLFLVAVALWVSVSDRPAAVDSRALWTDLRAAITGFRQRRLVLAATATVMLFVFQAVTAFLTTYLVTVRAVDQRTGFLPVGSLGSTVVGLLADRGLFDSPFYVIAGLTVLAAVVYASLPER